MKQEFPTVTCRLCGAVQKACYCDPHKTNMVNRSLCFYCNFWTDTLAEDAERPEQVVIWENNHYVILPDEPGNRFQGFGGARFTVYFADGRIVETRNLWHQGAIPDYFKDKFPTNCEQIEGMTSKAAYV